MNSRSLISRICSVGLLLVIMLSITPKSFLHELFANHDDQVSCSDFNLKGACIHKQGYSCQQSDLVVPSAFDLQFENALVHAKYSSDKGIALYSSSTLTNHLSGIAGRGPPAGV